MSTVRAAAVTVGARLASARRRAGRSQAALAAEVGCSASLLSKIERGAAELNDVGRARRLAELLMVSPVWLLGLGPDEPAAAHPVIPQSPHRVAGSGYDTRAVMPPDGEFAWMDRRRMLKAGAALAGGTLTSTLEVFDPSDRDRLLAALAAPDRNLSERVVRLLEHTDARYQRRRAPLPIGARMRLVDKQLAIVQRLRPAARTADHQQRLALVEAQTARLAGRLAANWAQDPQAAHRAYETALAAAHDAGAHSVTLRSYVLGGMAFLDSRFGQPKRAAATVTEALGLAEGSPVQGLRCWLSSTAATAYAGMGDRRGCDRALRQAEDLFVLPGRDDPSWMDFLSRGFLLEDRAACQLRTGNPGGALETLAEAERLVTPHRLERRALILAYQAEAMVRAGQPADGCQAAVQALDVAMTVGYRRVVDQVRTLRTVRLHQQRALPAVRELDELLRGSVHLTLPAAD